MTERTDRNIDSYLEELKKRRKREEWEEQRKREREQQERAAKQAALEAHLAQRARVWLDHTGSTPPQDVLSAWQRGYVSGQARRKEEELEAKRQEAANQPHYPGSRG